MYHWLFTYQLVVKIFKKNIRKLNMPIVIKSVQRVFYSYIFMVLVLVCKKIIIHILRLLTSGEKIYDKLR